MNADEMFEKSIIAARNGYGPSSQKGKNGSRYTLNGLTVRTYNCLYSAKLTRGKYESFDVDISRVKEMILSGDIFSVRNCGEATVRELCDWIERGEIR